jgi:GNAT superfamily N-acetyltransferase
MASPADIESLNRVFADAFTERYHRDGLVGVRVPQLNPDIWRYALRDAGAGAMLWYDEHDGLVAFNMVHRSGAEGWMGPLAVRTDRQEMGVGRTIVSAAIDWLSTQGVSTIGLETMPRTVENIGFYSRMGFAPNHLTVTMTGHAARRRVAGKVVRLSELRPDERSALAERCRRRLEQSARGYDYRREMDLTAELALGDTIVVEGDRDVAGFAIWHSAALVGGRPSEELRVLKLFADSIETFVRLLVALEGCAAAVGVRLVAIRCQTGLTHAYGALVERGYHVRWTDLRMTLEGYAEPTLPESEVLFSNWEI